jgi:hypothetical protein
MDKTATFTRWLCFSVTKDGFRTGSGFTKDPNRAKVYLRKPSAKSYSRSLAVVPVKIECTIDLEALTYTKISGTEYE